MEKTMRDHLLDLVEHTFDLGCIDTIKVQGDDKETTIMGCADDRTVVVEGKYHTPVAEFIGTFGMPNLGKLKILLNLPEYRENAEITLTKDSTGGPDGLLFENANRDFKNNYRFMSSVVISEKLKAMKLKEPTWHVEFEPTIAGIQKLKYQAQANAEEIYYQSKTENGDLKFFFGDHSTHAGNFIFHPGVSGQLKRSWSWPIKHVISILDLTGDKVMRISDDGATDIRVDSGIAVYRYIIPAQTK